jgi:hypothetical protein
MFKKKLKLRSFKEDVDFNIKNTNTKNDGPSYYPETKRGREFFDAHAKANPPIDKTGSPEHQFKSNLKKVNDHGPPKVDTYAGDPHSNTAIKAQRAEMVPARRAVKEETVSEALKAVVSRQNKNGSYNEVGTDTRTIFKGSEKNIKKKAREWAKGPHRIEFHQEDAFYKDPHKTIHVKENVETDGELTEESFQQLDENVRKAHYHKHHARALSAAQELLQHLNDHSKLMSSPHYNKGYYDMWNIKDIASKVEDAALSMGTHVENDKAYVDNQSKVNPAMTVRESVETGKYVSSSNTIRELLRKKK